uniref:Uncharacterized protein n=1 Tax=Anguilla anguilla TaxID=7936 RepID=A0A0E9UDF3_ANGAN
MVEMCHVYLLGTHLDRLRSCCTNLGFVIEVQTKFFMTEAFSLKSFCG